MLLGVSHVGPAFEAAAGLAVAGVAGGVIHRAYKARTYHFAEIDPGRFYRDGCRNPYQIARSVRRGRIKTIISLIGDDEVVSARFAPALAACRSAGAQTLRVPIVLGGWPTTENIDQFLKIVRDPANLPALIHCREGVRRTGMMASVYRMCVLGYDKNTTRSLVETFGHSQRTVTDIARFIELFDPATASISYPADLKSTCGE